LVADFDGPVAMLDALAYARAARAGALPAVLEIPQSGCGAHVWVFCSEAISAPWRAVSGPRWCAKAMVLVSMERPARFRFIVVDLSWVIHAGWKEPLPEGAGRYDQCRSVRRSDPPRTGRQQERNPGGDSASG